MKIPDHTVQTTYASPLGPMTLAATDRALVGAWFTDEAHLPDLTVCQQQAHHPLLQRAAKQLDEYFAGRRNRFDLPLNLGTGTPFQNVVWQALRAIDFGTTCTYGFVSAQIGRPKAMRAVGAAIGRNPLSIIVPCHRVIGAGGGLTGYAGGLHRKTALLQLEGVL
ncbi:MAG: methylated-DNA--[protein]-cysteine S-methyltransferase [Comamonadaceae bacterium]|nr:methylated-DNA--[protein]-cysteine S-methyltransferase [Comamonadaceae bacterium]